MLPGMCTHGENTPQNGPQTVTFDKTHTHTHLLWEVERPHDGHAAAGAGEGSDPMLVGPFPLGFFHVVLVSRKKNAPRKAGAKKKKTR